MFKSTTNFYTNLTNQRCLDTQPDFSSANSSQWIINNAWNTPLTSDISPNRHKSSANSSSFNSPDSYINHSTMEDKHGNETLKKNAKLIIVKTTRRTASSQIFVWRITRSNQRQKRLFTLHNTANRLPPANKSRDLCCSWSRRAWTSSSLQANTGVWQNSDYNSVYYYLGSRWNWLFASYAPARKSNDGSVCFLNNQIM